MERWSRSVEVGRGGGGGGGGEEVVVWCVMWMCWLVCVRRWRREADDRRGVGRWQDIIRQSDVQCYGYGGASSGMMIRFV